MKKPFIYLIGVWTLVSVSGLLIFLFQAYGPAAIPEERASINPALIVVFWGIMWFIPVVVLMIAARRQKE